MNYLLVNDDSLPSAVKGSRNPSLYAMCILKGNYKGWDTGTRNPLSVFFSLKSVKIRKQGKKEREELPQILYIYIFFCLAVGYPSFMEGS